MSIISCDGNDEPDVNNQDEAYYLNIPSHIGKPTNLNISNSLTKAGVDLGRHLFYDKILSKNYSISCSSCHKQELGFSDDAVLSVGINGQLSDRNSMSIVNTAWQNRFFWDGRASSLEEQALIPIQHPKEMGLDLSELVARLKTSELYKSKFENAFPGKEINEDLIAKALTQFQQTLISFNSRYDQYKLGKIQATEQEIRGEKLFFTHPDAPAGIRGANCGDCHSGALTFSNGLSNNGMQIVKNDVGLEGITQNASDRGKFKITTLRNIELTAPYMHDGRFKTLEEVVDHYNEHVLIESTTDPLILEATNNINKNGKLGLTSEEKQDIIAFLKMLTDKSFIENKEFGSPF